MAEGTVANKQIHVRKTTDVRPERFTVVPDHFRDADYAYLPHVFDAVEFERHKKRLASEHNIDLVDKSSDFEPKTESPVRKSGA